MTVKQLNAAQLAALRARQEAAAISPTAGANLGEALGNTFDFAPDDLPAPGSTPGGAAEGGMRPEAFGDATKIRPQAPLVDDRDALMAAGALPAAPPSPRPPPRSAKPTHPLLQRLREDLGITDAQVYDVQIGGHEWRLRALTAGDLPAIWRVTEQRSETFADQKMIYEGLFAAHSVIAVDQVPPHVLFAVDPGGLAIPDPYRPPRKIAHAAALRLYEFLEDQKAQVIQQLFRAYMDKCDADSAVESYLDGPEHKQVRFRCPECDDEVSMVPRRAPQTNEVIVPRCHWDATPMAQEDPDPLA